MGRWAVISGGETKSCASASSSTRSLLRASLALATCTGQRVPQATRVRNRFGVDAVEHGCQAAGLFHSIIIRYGMASYAAERSADPPFGRGSSKNFKFSFRDKKSTCIVTWAGASSGCAAHPTPTRPFPLSDNVPKAAVSSPCRHKPFSDNRATGRKTRQVGDHRQTRRHQIKALILAGHSHDGTEAMAACTVSITHRLHHDLNRIDTDRLHPDLTQNPAKAPLATPNVQFLFRIRGPHPLLHRGIQRMLTREIARAPHAPDPCRGRKRPSNLI